MSQNDVQTPLVRVAVITVPFGFAGVGRSFPLPICELSSGSRRLGIVCACSLPPHIFRAFYSGWQCEVFTH